MNLKKHIEQRGLIRINQNAEVLVTRNTSGNLLPGHSQTMTVREAMDYGAWDTVKGTMHASVKLINAASHNPPVYDTLELIEGQPYVCPISE